MMIIHNFTLSHAKAETATSILLFGDSIIAGYGLRQDESLPYQLETILIEQGHQVKVINGGVSGDTTAGGRGRLKWSVKKYNPDIVVLALGGNDVLRGIKPRNVYDNLDAMLQILVQYRTITLLSSVIAPANHGEQYQRDFNQIYPYLAAKYQVPLYPFLLESTFGNPDLMLSDQIHPNAKGIKVIARGLADYLSRHMIPTALQYRNAL